MPQKTEDLFVDPADLFIDPDNVSSNDNTSAPPVKKDSAKDSSYTGVFSGEHPFIEVLPKSRINPVPAHNMEIVAGTDKPFEDLRNYGIDRVANNPYLPESIKPLAAGMASFSLEPIRAAKDFINDPFGVVTSMFAVHPSASKALIPEVLPPEAPPIRRALPAARASEPIASSTTHEIIGPEDRVRYNYNVDRRNINNPIIVSPQGEALRENLITPVEDARMRGLAEEGKPTKVPAKAAVDLGEVKEKQRQADIFYTEHEHHGGTSLFIDPEDMPIPPKSGDTRLGFQPRSNADLPYPLNIVPDVVRPRAAQTVIRALAGDVEPVAAREPVTFANEAAPPKPVNTPARPDLMGGTAAINPGEPILPSAVREVKKNTGLNVENVDKVADAIPAAPEVKDAVKAGAANLVKESQLPSVAWKSIYKQLGDLGPAGKDLVQRFQRAATGRAQYDALWTEPLFGPATKLSKNEFANFGAYVEGRLPIPNSKVQNAVDAWKKAQRTMGATAEQVKLSLKRDGQVVPFQAIKEDYWPHIPAEPLTEPTIVDRLVSNGMSRHDAEIVAKTWNNTGEILIGPQHSRGSSKFTDLFKYRDDFDAGIIHGRSMSKRIANTEHLGPADIAGQGDQGIANLIEDTNDPELAYKLARRLAGRDELPNARLVKGLNQARKWMSLTSLPNFTMKNVILGQAQNAYMAALSKHPIEAVKEVSKLFSSAYREQIQATGAINNFARSLAEELQGKDPFAIGVGEKINRSVAAAIGKSTVRTAFQDYKNGVNVPSAKYFLETLLSRDPDTITKITPELENFGAARMAEITQGLNNPGNLPYGWSNPVNDYLTLGQQLALIFKKVGFQTTKTVKDTIKMNPKLALPLWLGISQVAGEMAGDVSSVITGKERTTDPIGRIASNWGNAFMLGLVWDLASSSQYGPSALLSAVAGPVASKASELGYNVTQTGKRLVEGEEDPFGPIRKFGSKNLPIPGRERISQAIEGE